MVPTAVQSISREKKVDHNSAVDMQDDLYNIKKCAQWITTHSLEKICLQFPDELLKDSANILLRLEKCVSAKIYILGDTSYGSCCVDEIAAQHINADGIIHFGHACLNPTTRLPVFHVLPKRSFNIDSFLLAFKEVFQDCTKKILLFYDVSYAYIIENIYKALKPVYEHLVLTTLNCTSDIEFVDTKQNSLFNILGRSYTLDNGYRIDDYDGVFLGKNEKTFTTLSMSIPARKWYYSHGNDINEFEPFNTPWLKRRRYLIEKLKDARIVGIVVATLVIKDYLKSITTIKNILKSKNKKSYILSIGKINPTKLANFPEIDAFVIITCPENEVFDSKDYLKPILMPYEVDLAFNSTREYSNKHCLDFRQILPGGMDFIEFQPSTDSDVSLISGAIRNVENEEPSQDKMNALTLSSPGTVAIGKAGAQFLLERSWKGVEQRLGQDSIHDVEIGRAGLPTHYKNEPVLAEKCNTKD